MEFSGQEYWSGLPCPPPGDLPHPGIKPMSLMSPALAVRFFTTSATWEACLSLLSSAQSLSHVQLFATPWIAARQASLSITNSRSSPKLNVHWAGDAIQPSHPPLSPSSPAFNLSQHQGLLKWVSSSHQVPKVLEFQLQHQSFQRTPRTELL